MSVYAVSDLHGNYAAYEAIKLHLQPDDVVYCLGDCGDRGPQSWETITAVYNDPQFIYMKGNHEDMLVNAMKEWLPDHISDYELYLLEHNGGRKTFQAWKNGPERNKWVTRLERLPVHLTYKNVHGQTIILTHAGYTPPEIPSTDLLIWDREHFGDAWEGYDDTVIVHGHTPVSYVMWTGCDASGEGYEVLYYCNGHKIDIDILTWRTNKVALLDLDTLEPTYLVVGENTMED